MVRKKLDNRIRVLIENGIASGHRSMFVVVGSKARDQVVILHHIAANAVVRARPTVLWCYKKDLGFSSHRKKRMHQLQKKIRSGKAGIDEEDPFEMFIAATNIRYCYYSETHRILGNTYGMCVLQDFEALTPNLLARTIETVEGGGLVVILLHNIASLHQLFTMAMDVHQRYRTESHKHVVGRFNERFLRSLSTCASCLVVDDLLNVLPISSHSLNLRPMQISTREKLTLNETELANLVKSLQETQPIGQLIKCCKTLDQAKAVLKFLDVITEKTLKYTVSLTAARGRGKSAALGIAVSGAIAFEYTNIFVTAPSPENLRTFFAFVCKGFDVMGYQEHLHYELVQSTNPDFKSAVIRVNVFRDHRQTIQYIHPADADKLGQAELVIIDEAAAIPLPHVRKLLGSYLVFLSSTVSGYEGTGRSLSLKLLQQLREQTALVAGDESSASASDGGKQVDKQTTSASGRVLCEIALTESIRYKPNDEVEQWLNRLLCLDASIVQDLRGGCPSPDDCELYYVNRDTLFCFHKASEAFLQRLMAIYVAAHYKNSPNDLQMISDAPAHHLFCLLGAVDKTQLRLPEILCVVEVCLEGEIAKRSITENLSRAKRPAGDLIPWTVAQQFQDSEFPALSGVRIVRIATHPNYQRMGYGSQAVKLLHLYYGGQIPSLAEENEQTVEETGSEEAVEEASNLLEEKIAPRKNLPPLLQKLSERKAEQLDWIGSCFGLTWDLLRFWVKNGYMPVYLRQVPNDLTGEHSCIVIKQLALAGENSWMGEYVNDFSHRIVTLLSYDFSSFSLRLAFDLLQCNPSSDDALTREELSVHFSNYDLKRLDAYSMNLVDHHLITDLLPTTARLIFLKKIRIHLSRIQSLILVGMGLQRKSVDDVAKELNYPTTQVLGLFNRVMKKISQFLNRLCERAIESTVPEATEEHSFQAPKQSLEKELEDYGKEGDVKVRKRIEDLLSDTDLSQYAVHDDSRNWNEALKSSKPLRGLLSVKRPSDLAPRDVNMLVQKKHKGKKTLR